MRRDTVLLTTVIIVLFCVGVVGGRGNGFGGGHGNMNGGGGRGQGRGDHGSGGRGDDGGGGHGGNDSSDKRKGLKEQFYAESCNGMDVEGVVYKVVKSYMDRDSTLAASLMRLQFHDCFLRGCDASILLDSTATNLGERESVANRFLRGLDIIDDAKAALEAVCPGVVSCADILALATRDAVGMLEAGPSWTVRTGRRDGLIANESEVSDNIPSPFFHFSQLRDLFTIKGFSVPELIILSGAHTIGRAHCGSFSIRLYNNSGVGDTDPSLDPNYAAHLKTICSPSDRTTAVPMDPDTPLVFDNNYYNLLQENKGLFRSDAALLVGNRGRGIVYDLSRGRDFPERFVEAMVKLVELDVLTGSDGEIRKNCHFVNSDS